MAKELSILTDGFSFRDLESLKPVAEREAVPQANAKALVNHYRYGRRDHDPWEALKGPQFEAELKISLEKDVIGQDQAITKVIETLVNAAGGIGLDSPESGNTRPKGVLFFVGPTGVGKTEMAKAINMSIFGDEANLLRFDMSEYKDQHDSIRLVGAPPSYVGYGEGGQLTNALKAKPFCVILFDEVDKAHPLVLDKFLQILDDGRLTDGMGETVSFAHSLIIFTSNAGSEQLQLDGRKERPFQEIRTIFTSAVKRSFESMKRPELFGRIGKENIVPFDMLRDHAIHPILEQKFLRNVRESFLKKTGSNLEIDSSIADACVENIDRGLGGRDIRNFVQSKVLPAINRAAMEPRIGNVVRVIWDSAAGEARSK